MNLFAIYGSPRPKGNSDIMLDYFLEGAEAAGALIKRVYVRRLTIYGCIGCGHCDTQGFCFRQDDMQNLYECLATYPRIVASSPNYFYGLPGQLKCLIDRSQALFMAQRLPQNHSVPLRPLSSHNRKGFFLGVGATHGPKLFECCRLTMRYFFDAISVEYSGDICKTGIDKKGAIKKYPEILEECKKAGYFFIITNAPS